MDCGWSLLDPEIASDQALKESNDEEHNGLPPADPADPRPVTALNPILETVGLRLQPAAVETLNDFMGSLGFDQPRAGARAQASQSEEMLVV